MPEVKRTYMPNEISLVLFVLITRIACGTNDTVVQAAAASPMSVEKSIGIISHGRFIVLICFAVHRASKGCSCNNEQGEFDERHLHLLTQQKVLGTSANSFPSKKM